MALSNPVLWNADQTTQIGVPLVGRDEAVVTILDDEVKFESITPTRVVEGGEPSNVYTFTAVLDGPPAADVVLAYVVEANAPGLVGAVEVHVGNRPPDVHSEGL